jgi:hypothetical protein
MNISVFRNVYSMEEPLKRFLLFCVNWYLWKSAVQKGKKQLVPHRNYHSTANCRTKFRPYLEGYLESFAVFRHFFVLFHYFSRNSTFPHNSGPATGTLRAPTSSGSDTASSIDCSRLPADTTWRLFRVTEEMKSNVTEHLGWTPALYTRIYNA